MLRTKARDRSIRREAQPDAIVVGRIPSGSWRDWRRCYTPRDIQAIQNTRSLSARYYFPQMNLNNSAVSAAIVLLTAVAGACTPAAQPANTGVPESGAHVSAIAPAAGESHLHNI